MANNGWASLGAAFAGNGSLVQDAYERGQTNAARVAGLIADARNKRDEAMARDQLEQSLVSAGGTPAQAGLIATALRGGFDPTKISGYQGDIQEQGFRGDAVARALAGDWGGANATLVGVANGPVELASVQGQNLIANRYLPGGGGISTTEQGRAAMAADAAQAANAYASAARTRQNMGIDAAQFALQRSGRWDPDGSAKAAGAPGGLKLSEGQSKDVLYYTRGNEANKLLDTLDKNLTATGGQQGAVRGTLDAALRGLPVVGDSAFVNNMVSDRRQVAEQAGQEFLASILRKDTGAAITPQEFEIYGAMYLPRPGDSAAQLEQKRQARSTALQAVRASMGGAAAALPEVQAVAPRSIGEALGGAASRAAPTAAPRTISGALAGAGAAVQRARNPQTGQTLILVNGQWVPE